MLNDHLQGIDALVRGPYDTDDQHLMTHISLDPYTRNTNSFPLHLAVLQYEVPTEHHTGDLHPTQFWVRHTADVFTNSIRNPLRNHLLDTWEVAGTQRILDFYGDEPIQQQIADYLATIIPVFLTREVVLSPSNELIHGYSGIWLAYFFLFFQHGDWDMHFSTADFFIEWLEYSAQVSNTVLRTFVVTVFGTHRVHRKLLSG